MKDNYSCSYCGRKNVKLWRPYGYSSPLICATCAEKKQSVRKCKEVVWKNDGDRLTGKDTGKIITLPKWEVDRDGLIPANIDLGPDGMPVLYTDQLVVNLQDVSDEYTSNSHTSVIPAVPDEDGNFWCYTTVPEDKVAWWKNLPTK